MNNSKIIDYSLLSDPNKAAMRDIRESFEQAKQLEETITEMRKSAADQARLILAEVGASSVRFDDGYSIVWSVGERGTIAEQRLKEALLAKGISAADIADIVGTAKKMTVIDNCYGKRAKE